MASKPVTIRSDNLVLKCRIIVFLTANLAHFLGINESNDNFSDINLIVYICRLKKIKKSKTYYIITL